MEWLNFVLWVRKVCNMKEIKQQREIEVTRKLWCNKCWEDTPHHTIKYKYGLGCEFRCKFCNSLYIYR